MENTGFRQRNKKNTFTKKKINHSGFVTWLLHYVHVDYLMFDAAVLFQ